MNVLVGIDASGRHPEAQMIIVSRKREGHPECERLLAFGLARGDHAGERARRYDGIDDASLRRRGDGGVKRGRHRDGVAVHPQSERRHDRHLDVAEAEARCDRDRRQQMRGIEQADIELVAHVRPRHLAHELDIKPLGSGEALIDRNDQRGRVGQRDEPDPQSRLACGHRSSSAAVTTDWATSAIFLFSFIAVLRSST
jgi:hypothetical protein